MDAEPSAGDEREASRIKYSRLWLYLGLVIALWGLSWLLIVKSDSLSSWAYREQFGGMFGAVSSLFSGLAFAGLIFTIQLQKEELRLTRTEVRDQTRWIERQARTLEIQAFRDMFFQMLRVQMAIVEAMRIVGPSPHLGEKNMNVGRACFVEFYSTFRNQYRHQRNNLGKDDQSAQTSAFEAVLKDHRDLLSPYLGNLEQLFEFLEWTGDRVQRRFGRIVRANLTEDELLLLFYHCTCPSATQMRALAEKYGLFRDLNRGRLLDDSHCLLIDSGAYKD
jgi:hypothetical protein